jgi:hypothetical protein
MGIDCFERLAKGAEGGEEVVQGEAVEAGDVPAASDGVVNRV